MVVDFNFFFQTNLIITVRLDLKLNKRLKMLFIKRFNCITKRNPFSETLNIGLSNVTEVKNLQVVHKLQYKSNKKTFNFFSELIITDTHILCSTR